MPSLLVAGCLFIVLLLAEALLTVVTALRGVHYTAFSHWADPSILFVVLCFAGMVALMLVSLLALPAVVSFEFDIRNCTLVYTESRPGRGLLVTTVSFESIVAVRPLLMTTYATDGGFEISLRWRNGSVLTKQMGDGIPVDLLRTHAAWLKRELDDRVEPTLQLDT